MTSGFPRFTRFVIGYERPRTLGRITARKRLAAIRIASGTYRQQTAIAAMFRVPYWLVVPGRVPSRHELRRHRAELAKKVGGRSVKAARA